MARRKKARYLHELINQYTDLARSMNDVTKSLRESAMMCWRMSDVDMAEWHEYKSNDFFEYADFYERGATKAFKEIQGDSSKES